VILITYSFKHFSSTFLTIFFLIEPFPVAFFAWIFLGEFLSPFNVMGFVLIAVGIYLAKTGKGSDRDND
jgi:drug/metabolite transporter (DMT)-like permease